MTPAAAPPRAGRGARRRRPIARVLLAMLFGGVVGLALFTVSYAEGASYLSDDPEACRNCHVMNDVHDAWTRGPHHAVATCNDCHIPHTFPAKYVVKGLNGWNHSVAFTTQDFPEPIRITAFNKGVALDNCVHCHGDFVSLVEHEGQPAGEDCTRCHATVGHDENSAGRP